MVTPGIYGSPRAKCFCFQRTRKELQNPGKTPKQRTYSIPFQRKHFHCRFSYILRIYLRVKNVLVGLLIKCSPVK